MAVQVLLYEIEFVSTLRNSLKERIFSFDFNFQPSKKLWLCSAQLTFHGWAIVFMIFIEIKNNSTYWILKLIHLKIHGIIDIKEEWLAYSNGKFKPILFCYMFSNQNIHIYIYNTHASSIIQKHNTCVHHLSPFCIYVFSITFMCLLILMTHISSQAHTLLRLSFAITCCIRHIYMLEPKISLRT